MSDPFMRPDNDPEPTSADYEALADSYQAGYDRATASGYEEYGWRWRKDRLMTIEALRGYARSSERTSEAPAVDDDANMVKISGLISTLQGIKDRFGDTCVYIRRGGLSWGAVALNRQDDDKKHGVFDLQAQHDRDMLQRAEQVERLKASRNAAESRLCQIRDASHKGSMTPAERLQDIRVILDRVSSTVTEGGK